MQRPTSRQPWRRWSSCSYPNHDSQPSIQAIGSHSSANRRGPPRGSRSTCLEGRSQCSWTSSLSQESNKQIGQDRASWLRLALGRGRDQAAWNCLMNNESTFRAHISACLISRHLLSNTSARGYHLGAWEFVRTSCCHRSLRFQTTLSAAEKLWPRWWRRSLATFRAMSCFQFVSENRRQVTKSSNLCQFFHPVWASWCPSKYRVWSGFQIRPWNRSSICCFHLTSHLVQLRM